MKRSRCPKRCFASPAQNVGSQGGSECGLKRTAMLRVGPRTFANSRSIASADAFARALPRAPCVHPDVRRHTDGGAASWRQQGGRRRWRMWRAARSRCKPCGPRATPPPAPRSTVALHCALWNIAARQHCRRSCLSPRSPLSPHGRSHGRSHGRMDGCAHGSEARMETRMDTRMDTRVIARKISTCQHCRRAAHVAAALAALCHRMVARMAARMDA